MALSPLHILWYPVLPWTGSSPNFLQHTSTKLDIILFTSLNPQGTETISSSRGLLRCVRQSTYNWTYYKPTQRYGPNLSTSKIQSPDSPHYHCGVVSVTDGAYLLASSPSGLQVTLDIFTHCSRRYELKFEAIMWHPYIIPNRRCLCFVSLSQTLSKGTFLLLLVEGGLVVLCLHQNRIWSANRLRSALLDQCRE